MHTGVTLLNESGRWLVAQLGRMSVELAILAGIVLVALYVLRVKSPALRHLFWGLLLAKPVVTFLVASPLSLYAVFWPPAPKAVFTPPPVAVQAEQAYLPLPAAPPPQAAPPAPAPLPEKPPFWRQIDRYGLASALWLSAASILGLRLLLGCTYVTFLRTTARTRRAGILAELVAEAAATLRVRRHVAIATTTVCHGPVLAGIFRPVILLPENMADALTRAQLKLVVTHELAHARRWDNLVLLIQRLAEMLFFFHPVVWLCGWMMRREAEAACDDMVVTAYGDADGAGAAAYADSLTRVAEMKCGITRRLLVNTFAAAESNFHRRIRRILGGRRTRMTLWLSLATGAALILIAALGLPAASSPKNSSKDDENGFVVVPRVKSLDETVRQKWQAEGLASEVEISRRLCTETISILEKRFEAEGAPDCTFSRLPFDALRINLKRAQDSSQIPNMKSCTKMTGSQCFHSVADADALHAALEALKNNESLGKPFLALLVPPKESSGKVTVPMDRSEDAWSVIVTINKTPGLLPEGMKFATWMDYETSSEPIRELLLMKSEPALKGFQVSSAIAGPSQDGHPGWDVTAVLSPEQGTQFGDFTQAHLGHRIACALDAAVWSAPVVRARITDRVVLARGLPESSARRYAATLMSGPLPAPLDEGITRIEEPETPQPAAGTSATALEKELDMRGSLVFQDVHVSEILNFVTQSHKAMNFVIDWRVVEMPAGMSARADARPFGRRHDCVTDGVLPYLEIKNAPWRDIFRALLKPMDLTFVVKEHYVWVSSPEMVRQDAAQTAPAPRNADPTMLKALATPAGIKFEDISVRDILKYVSDNAGINISVDDAVVPAANADGKEDSSTYVTNGFVPRVELQDVPVSELLEAVLRPLDLVAVVDGNTVRVTSYDRAGEGGDGGKNIGTYDAQAIIRDFKTREKAYGDLQAYVKTLQEGLDKKSQAVQQEKETLENEKDSLSAEDGAARKEKLDALYKEYQAELQAKQHDIDEREKTLLDFYAKEVKEAARKAGDELGCDSVKPAPTAPKTMEGTPEPAGVRAHDLTPRIRELLGDKLTETPSEGADAAKPLQEHSDTVTDEEAIKAKEAVEAKWDGINSYTAVIETTNDDKDNVRGGYTMRSRVSALKNAEGVLMYRMEIDKVTFGNPDRKGFDKFLKVYDGKDEYHEMQTAEGTTVRVRRDAFDVDLSNGAVGTRKTFEECFKNEAFTLLPEEEVGGKGVYVFEGRSKRFPKVTPYRLYIDKETGFQLKYERGHNRSVLSEVKLNTPVDPSLFKYTPPENAAIIDASISTEPGSRDNPERFVGDLQNGRSVELVCVREHKTGNKSAWRPDGTPLAAPPYDPDKLAESVAGQGKAYEFAFRTKGIESDEPMQYRFEGSTGWAMTGSSDNLATSIATVCLDAKATTENITVSVASGDWTTLITEAPLDGNGGSARGAQEYSVIFGATYEKDGAACVTVTLEGSLSEQAVRLCAVDAQGQLHPSSAHGCSAGKARQTAHSFAGMKPQDIKEFQLQTCPWQEVRFTSISLVPGTLTDCRVTVSAVAMQAKETSPDPPNAGGTPAQSATAEEEQVRQVTEMMQQYDPVVVPGAVSRPSDTQQATGQSGGTSGPLILAPLPGFLDDKVKAEWQAQGVNGDRAVLGRLQDQTLEIMQKRLDGAGMKDVQITKQANGRISVQIPPSVNVTRASLLLTQPGMSRFCPAASRDEVVQALQEIEKNPSLQGRLTGLFDTKSKNDFLTVSADKHAAAAAIVGEINDARPRLLPEGKMFFLGSKNSPNMLYLIDKNSPMANVKVKSASATPDTVNPGKAKINFSFSDGDAQRFGDLTQSLIGKGLAILVNWEVQSVPIVRSKVTQSGQIVGNYTLEEAADIAARISVPEYPAQLLVLSDPTATPGNLEPAKVGDVRKALETRYYGGIDEGLWNRLLCKFLVPVFDPATGEELSFAKYDKTKDELSVRNLPDNLAVFEVMMTHFKPGQHQTEPARKKEDANAPHVTIKDSSNVSFTAGKIEGDLVKGRLTLTDNPTVSTPEVPEIRGEQVVIETKDKTVEVKNARVKEAQLAAGTETAPTGWHEDFERHACGTGTWPEGCIADGNASNHEVCYVDGATFKDTHGNTLRLHGDTPAWSPLAHFMTSVNVPFQIAFDVYLESKDPKCTCVVGVRTKPSWTAPGVILFDTIPPGDVNGMEPVAEGGGMSKGQTFEQLHMEPSKWYRVELTLQEKSGRQTLSATLNDGATTQGPVQVSADALVKDMPYLQLEVRSGTAWFDNVSMSPVAPGQTVSSNTRESSKAIAQNTAGNDGNVGAAHETNPGKIAGVVRDLQGKPVTDAYVGVGDTGDSGGSNHDRHRQEGVYTKGKTDGEGRFALDGLALNREHLLFVTHPDFVRQDRKFTLDSAQPIQDFTFSLKAAGKINVTVTNAAGTPEGDSSKGKFFFRLEALDGHKFIPPGRDPHLSAFASSVWFESRAENTFSFSALDAGEYALDVIREFPVSRAEGGETPVDSSDAALTAEYYGGRAPVSVKNGEVVDAAVPPVENGTRVRIGIPKAPDVPATFPRIFAITRDLAFLTSKPVVQVFLEDPRLGNMWQGALYSTHLPGSLFVGDERDYTYCTIANLPQGKYCVVGGTLDPPRGALLEVVKGQTQTIELPGKRGVAERSSAPDTDNAPQYTAEMKLMSGTRLSVDSLCADLRADREMEHGPEAERAFITRDEKGIEVVFAASDRYSDLELISAPRVTFKAAENPAASEGKEGGEMPKVVLRAETAGPRFVPGEVMKMPALEAFFGDYSVSLLDFYRNEKPTAVIADIREDMLDRRVRGEEPRGIPEGVAMAVRLTGTEQPDAFDLKFYFNRKDVVQPSRGLAFWKPAPPPDVFESPVALHMTPPNPYRLGEWVVVVTKHRDPEKLTLAMLHIDRAAPGTLYAESQTPAAMADARTAYREAEKSYVHQDYKEALEQSAKYVEQHPYAEHAEDARFLKAKCLLNLDRHAEAATEFEKFRLDYPTSKKADAAMREESLCRARQGQTQRAIELLQQIVRDYPFTRAADQAKQDLALFQRPV